MRDTHQVDTHVLLWVIIAFCLGTLWEPAMELVAPSFTVDNQVGE